MTHEDSRPLNVRVAEALGFRVEDRSVYGCKAQCISSVSSGGNFPHPHGRHDHIQWEYWKPYEWEPEDGDWMPALDYPNDWSATGPLIERLYLDFACYMPDSWRAWQGYAKMEQDANDLYGDGT